MDRRNSKNQKMKRKMKVKVSNAEITAKNQISSVLQKEKGIMIRKKGKNKKIIHL